MVFVLLEQESKRWKRKNKEALHSKAEKATMNLGQGLQLNCIFKYTNSTLMTSSGITSLQISLLYQSHVFTADESAMSYSMVWYM